MIERFLDPIILREVENRGRKLMMKLENRFYKFGPHRQMKSFDKSYTPDLIESKLKNLDTDKSFIYHNKNWMYSFSENFFAYSYDITYFLYDVFFDENVDLRKKYYWGKSLLSFDHSYLMCLLMDQIYFLAAFALPVFNNFSNHLFNSYEFNNFLINHPEYIFIFKSYSLNFFNNYLSNWYVSLHLLTINESYLSPVMLLTQFLFMFLLVMFLLTTYFNYYTNSNTSENIIDHDYLIYNVTIESEEEIGSIDDMLLTSVILLYIFLWFFWIYSWSSINITPQLIMSIYLFPFIYYIIFFIPFSLLYDYGSYFLTYLNGVGKSSTLAVELLFDYIAVSIFYLRLMVQNVRLVFMLFTYAELHEMIIFYSTEKNLLLANDSFHDSYNKDNSNSNSSSYFLIFSLPTHLVRWLYELFHTFFMVIFQFIAFFAMIFWLFLFLYTMFILETQENYLTYKRISRKKIIEKINQIKIVKK